MIDPEAGTLGRELARIGGQESHLKTRYNVVKSRFPIPSRQLLEDAQANLLGYQIATRKNEVTEKGKQRQRQQRQANKFAARTGVELPPRAQEKITPDNARELAAFLNGEDAAVSEPAAAESLPPDNGPVVYKLKPFDQGKS